MFFLMILPKAGKKKRKRGKSWKLGEAIIPLKKIGKVYQKPQKGLHILLNNFTSGMLSKGSNQECREIYSQTDCYKPQIEHL